MNACRSFRYRRAFSLIELIIVVSLLILIASLALPAIHMARSSADRLACQSQLRQIAISTYHYVETKGVFPPAFDQVGAFPHKGGRNYQAFLGWLAILLPYLDQNPLWSQSMSACQSESWTFITPPHLANSTIVPLLICPGDTSARYLRNDKSGRKWSLATYIGVGASEPGKGDGIIVGIKRIRPEGVLDGLCNTLMIGERPPPNDLIVGRWYSAMSTQEFDNSYAGEPSHSMAVTFPIHGLGCEVPITFGPGRPNNECDRFHFWSFHGGGSSFAFADGSVRFLSYNIFLLMPALATRAGGEVIEVP